MSPWWLLVPAALSFALGSWGTYWWPKSDLFSPLYMLTCCLAGACWVIAVARFETREQVFLFSLVWDALMVAAFYAVPALALGGLSWRLLLGGAIVVSGFIVIKLGG